MNKKQLNALKYYIECKINVEIEKSMGRNALNEQILLDVAEKELNKLFLTKF